MSGVGLLGALRPGLGPADLVAAAALAPANVTALASPWAPPSHLASVVWADVFGARLAPLTREEAMRVPAVRRARNVVCGTIARIDLNAYRGTDRLERPAAPSWLDSTAGPLSPFHRMIWTVDDLFFYGWSCWSRVNGADGFPTQMDRLPRARWTFEADTGRVLIDRADGHGLVYARNSEVVLIPGTDEGMLAHAAESIRHAGNLHRAADDAAHNPTPHTVLKQTGGTPLTETQIDALLDRYTERRRRTGGKVSFMNESIDLQESGSFDSHLLIEGRNAAAVDIARHANIPADLLDAAGPAASLTYQNSRDNDRRVVDYGIGPIMSAVSGALSQNGVTPNGQRVAFDLEEWLTGTVPGQPADSPAPAVPAPAAAGAPTPTTPGETPQ